MSTWHQTQVVGNLGHDPELKYLQNGNAVCNFSVAVNEKWTTKSGVEDEKTTWYRVNVWGKQAENCNRYLAKGSKVLVVGTVSANAYTDRRGDAAASLELRAFNVRFLMEASPALSREQMGRQPAVAEQPDDFDSIPF